MRPFVYYLPANSEGLEAVFAGAFQDVPPIAAKAQFIAAGTTILDLMKLDVARPEILIDINQIGDLAGIEATSDGLQLGALARMDDVARHAGIVRQYPVIARSLDFAASTQIRNMASLGGNVRSARVAPIPGHVLGRPATSVLRARAALRWTVSIARMRCSGRAAAVSRPTQATLPRR